MTRWCRRLLDIDADRTNVTPPSSQVSFFRRKRIDITAGVNDRVSKRKSSPVTIGNKTCYAARCLRCKKTISCRCSQFFIGPIAFIGTFNVVSFTRKRDAKEITIYSVFCNAKFVLDTWNCCNFTKKKRERESYISQTDLILKCEAFSL